MKIKFILLIFCINFIGDLSARVRILTFHYNRPDFIEMQYLTLKKFMQDDYELIVFNDAESPEMEHLISSTCKSFGIKCVRFDQNQHKENRLNEYILKGLNDGGLSHLSFNGKNFQGVSTHPSIRHAHVIQFAMEKFGYTHNDIVVIMDGDIFPIRPFCLKSSMHGVQLFGIYKTIEERISYFWVPFVAMDMRILPNKCDLKFHPDFIENTLCDTGSQSYHYLKNNPKIATKKFDWLSSSALQQEKIKILKDKGFTKNEISLIHKLHATSSVEFHIEKHFLHYGASSFNMPGSFEKSQYVIAFLKKITRGISHEKYASCNSSFFSNERH